MSLLCSRTGILLIAFVINYIALEVACFTQLKSTKVTGSCRVLRGPCAFRLKTSEKPLDLLSQELKELTEGIQEFQEKTFESLYSKKVLWSSDRSKSNSGDDDSIRSDVVASAIEETGAASTPTEESVPVPAVAPVAEPVSEPASTPVLTTDVASVKKIDPPVVATETGKAPAPLIASKEIISEASVSATSTNVLTAGSAGGMESDVSVLLKDVPVDTTKSVDPDIEKLQILKAQQTISKSFLSLSDVEEESTVTEARVAPAAARISSSSSSAKQPSALDSIFDIFKSDATAKRDAPKDSNVVSKITTTSTITQQPLVEVPPTPTVVIPPPVVIKKPTVAPSPAIQSPLLSGLFGFLSPSPGFQGSATPTKKTTAAPPKPSLSVPEVEDSPTILPPQEEAFARKNVELVAAPPRAAAAAVKSADSSTAATKSKGLFGFLGDSSEDFFEDDPTSTSRKGKRLLVSDADEERDVAPPTAVKSVETKSTSGGLFGFLSPPSIAPAKKLSVVSEVEKKGRSDAVAAPVVVAAAKVVAPPAVKQASLKVPVKAVVKDVNKAAKPVVVELKKEAKPVESSVAAKTSSVGGGFFGFLNLPPAAPVKKSVAPAIVSKVTPPVVKPIAKKELVAAPIIKKEAKTISSGGGGLFGFLNPSPAAIKKPVVVVPDVEAKPEAPALSLTRKLSNPLNAKPAAPKSVTISPMAKLVLPPVVKQITPKVIVKDVNKAAKPVVVELKKEAKPVESSVAAKTSSVGGGFFGFLNLPPAAPVKKSEEAQINTSPIAAVRPAPPMVSKPVASTAPPQQQQRRPQEKAKPLNLFGFLDSSENFFEDQPSSLPPTSNVKGQVSPLPPKVESPVAAKTSSVGGGFFGFLNLPAATPVKKSVAPAIVSKVAPPVVKPIAKKELVAAPIIKKEAKTISSGGGGLFGFLNPSPAAIKKPVVVVPEVKAPTFEKEAKTISSGGGGLFGFLNPSPAAIKKPVDVPEVKAPAGSPPAVETKKTNSLNARPATSKIAAPVVKSTAVVAAKTGSAGGGLFGFFNPSPAPSVKKPIVETAAAVPVASLPTKQVTNPLNGKPALPKNNAVPSLKTAITKVVAGKAPVKELVAAPIIKKEAKTSSSGGGGMFGFLNPSPAAIKKPVVDVPEVKAPAGSPPAVEAKKTNPLNARPAVSKIVQPPPVTKPTPSSMDKSFQLSVSKLLKGDTKKIMLFQKATDSFRSGGVSAADYIVSLEKLFGSDVLGTSIIPPLTAQLPEKERASELRKAYEQTRKTGSSCKDKKMTK